VNKILYRNSFKCFMIFLKKCKGRETLFLYSGNKNSVNEIISYRDLNNHYFAIGAELKKYIKFKKLNIWNIPNLFIGNIWISKEFQEYISSLNYRDIIKKIDKNNFNLRIEISKLYRSYILKNKKIILCIYTCEKDREKLNLLKKSNWYSHYSKYRNIKFIEVYAGNNILSFENKKLLLNTEESYSNLSMKTYHMIDFVYKNFDFDYFMKLDCGIINRPTKIRQFTFNNFVNNFENKLFYREYDGVLNVENHTFKSIHGWANGKGFFVDPESIFIKENNIPDFWGGNCYVLDKNNCGIISNNKQNFQLFKDKMAGCEDLCVGYTLKQNGVINWKS